MKKILLIPTLAAMSAAPLTVLSGCTVHLNPPTPPEPEETELCFTKVDGETETSTIGYEKVEDESFPLDIDIQYKLNNGAWGEWDGTPIELENDDDKLYVKNNTSTLSVDGEFSYIQFTMSGGNVSASGSVNSMINNGSISDYCFCNLFKNCDKLIKAPDLPATQLADFCYKQMFSGCTNLTQIPNKLPATTLAHGCYEAMFQGCESLTNSSIPALPAKNLAQGCYMRMFENCDGLTTLPANLLPATDLTEIEGCYAQMFSDCDALTTLPENLLPAENLAFECYSSMFGSCDELASVPKLPASNLAENCYSSMFWQCPKITTAPILNATTLPEGCYQSMFQECTSLTQIPTLPVATSLGGGCYTQMFYGCSALKVSENIGEELICDFTGVSGDVSDYADDMFSETGGPFAGTPTNKKYYLYQPIPLYFEKEEATGTSFISYTIEGELSDIEIQTSSNGKDWNSWDGQLLPLSSTTRLYVRNTSNTLSTDDVNYFHFNIVGGDVKASGNVNSMINYHSLSSYCFYELFYNCTSLTQASDLQLPATTLADNCYNHMFSGCSSLEGVPELPAKTLTNSCYSYMFSDCSSLEEAPELSATTLAQGCYSDMFNSCTSLTEAPELPATELVEFCYEAMFSYCESLKVKENDSTDATMIFTCPSVETIITDYANNMFTEISSESAFTGGTPTPGSTYYWY